MKYDEFMSSTQKLCELYGKNLNETQVEFWFESLKQFEIMLYQVAIGQYAKKNKYMPTISDILTEISVAKRIVGDQNNIKNNEQPREKCEKCHGTGLIKYYRNNYEYLCTCNCRNGRSLNYPLLKRYDDVLHCVDNSFKVLKKRNEVSLCNEN